MFPGHAKAFLKNAHGASIVGTTRKAALLRDASAGTCGGGAFCSHL